MTLLAIYSLSFSVQLCEVTSIDLPLTKEFYCTSCPRQPDLPPSTFLLYHCWNKTSLGRGGYIKTTNTIYKIYKFLYLGVQQRKVIQLLEEWRGGWYNQSISMVTIQLRAKWNEARGSNSFPDLVVVVAMQTYQAIKKTIVSGEKVGQLNAAGPKSQTQHQFQATMEKLRCSLGLTGSDVREEGLIVFKWFSDSMSLREVTGPNI